MWDVGETTNKRLAQTCRDKIRKPAHRISKRQLAGNIRNIMRSFEKLIYTIRKCNHLHYQCGQLQISKDRFLSPAQNPDTMIFQFTC